MNPQIPMVHGSHSPYPQPHAPTGPPTGSAVPNVPLTPASAHSSQLATATALETSQQPAEAVVEQSPQPDPSVNGNANFDSEPSQQPDLWSPFEMSITTDEDTPKPNPRFTINQVPYYTDPDSKALFAAKRRTKKKVKPIEGQDVTMQASQPGQTEDAVESTDAGNSTTTGNTPNNAGVIRDVQSTKEIDTNAAGISNSQPTAQTTDSEGSSTGAAPSQPSRIESPKTHSIVLAADDTTTDNKPENSKDGDVVKSEGAPAGPRVWADLFNKVPVASKVAPDGQATTNGTDETHASGTLGPSQPTTKQLADVLKEYNPSNGKVLFIEPRGLYNARVDCYMISILQVLLYCTPFYNFLHQVKTQSTQSLKFNTPLLDALIDFQSQFKIIKSADTSQQLKEGLTPEQHRQYGETLHATSVFDAAFRSPAIKKLERGKQQDAEEFLTLLLEALNDECVKVIEAAGGNSNLRAPAIEPNATNEWQTVEKGGKPAVTQSSGLPELPNPVSKIFKGKQRSEVRVKQSISNTDQPFINLKLYIEDQSIKTIVDALLRMNATENLSATEKSKSTFQNSGPAKTQQTFIHKLPCILVMHLIRFKSAGNSWAKNGKHVDYPLELEIPTAVLSKPARVEYARSRKYRLVAVVYHHGADKDSGHYSVDVRRQDDESWLRINDTKVEAIDSTDVVGTDKSATTGASKDAMAEGPNSNRFAAVSDNDNADGGTWQNVRSSGNGGKKNSNIGNDKPSSGTSTPRGTPVKDNKVAYLLFYQQLRQD